MDHPELTTEGFAQIQREHMRPWMAALVDGEGCINMSKHHHRNARGPAYRVTVIVSNTNRAILDAIAALTGLGKVTQSRPERTRWRAQFEWRTSGCGQSRTFLDEIQPWLIVKRQQAEVALKACAILTPGNRWKHPDRELLECLKLEMHRLNARGVRPAEAV
jgi:hypothetical protein